MYLTLSGRNYFCCRQILARSLATTSFDIFRDKLPPFGEYYQLLYGNKTPDIATTRKKKQAKVLFKKLSFTKTVEQTNGVVLLTKPEMID